jgi:uncharacterized protein YegL
VAVITLTILLKLQGTAMGKAVDNATDVVDRTVTKDAVDNLFWLYLYPPA